MWYQMQLYDQDVWEDRICADFFEKIPGMHQMDHFDYKLKRDNLGDAYTASMRARKIAKVSIAISLFSLALGLVKFLAG